MGQRFDSSMLTQPQIKCKEKQSHQAKRSTVIKDILMEFIEIEEI